MDAWVFICIYVQGHGGVNSHATQEQCSNTNRLLSRKQGLHIYQRHCRFRFFRVENCVFICIMVWLFYSLQHSSIWKLTDTLRCTQPPSYLVLFIFFFNLDQLLFMYPSAKSLPCRSVACVYLPEKVLMFKTGWSLCWAWLNAQNVTITLKKEKK